MVIYSAHVRLEVFTAIVISYILYLSLVKMRDSGDFTIIMAAANN